MLRYAGESKWNDQFKEDNWRAFQLRREKDGSLERGLSFYWHEIFPGLLEDQLHQVRIRRRLGFGRSAHLLEIHIAVATELLRSELDAAIYAILHFIRDPLLAGIGKRADGTCGRQLDDPSHCLLHGVEQLAEQLRTAIAQALACAVTRAHPALKPAS